MLKYKLVERGKPGDPESPKKFYAMHKSSGKKALSNMSRDIADISSLSRGDISNVLQNLVDQVPKYLLDGQTVSLGELGTFRLTLSSEGAETDSEFNTTMIKGVKIGFIPGKLLKEAVEKAHFERVV